MAPKRPDMQVAKSQRRTGLSLALVNEKGAMHPQSQEPEDLDITQMAQQVMNAVRSVATSL